MLYSVVDDVPQNVQVRHNADEEDKVTERNAACDEPEKNDQARHDGNREPSPAIVVSDVSRKQIL
jgi:hypothetical protein